MKIDPDVGRSAIGHGLKTLNANLTLAVARGIVLETWFDYFVMPLRTRARVVLRNDTDRDAVDYGYVEWEKIPRWDGRLGHFHATFDRRSFRLLRDTPELLFDL